MSTQRFFYYTVGLWFYTLIVILWGAWVRISRSGDGCGESWPLCHGQVVPDHAVASTWIELSHRLSSGVYGILVVVMVVWAWRLRQRGRARRDVVNSRAFWWAAVAALIFTVSEALLGAKLVLSGLVGDNQSFGRLVVMGLHMLNSMMLTASVAACALFVRAAPVKSRQEVPSFHLWFLGVTLSLMVISSSGAVAALASTLFPAESILQGMMLDLFHPHWILRWRVWHPALASGFLLMGLGVFYRVSSSLDGRSKGVLQSMVFATAGAVLFGFVTLFSLSPVWMKLMHLFVAHSLWVFLLISLYRLFWVTQPLPRKL